MEVFILILFFLFVLLIIGFLSGARKRREKREEIQTYLKDKCDAKATYISFMDFSCVGISWDAHKIYLGTGAQPTEYDFSQVVAVDLDIDRVTVASSKGSSRTGRGSQLAGAAVGGLAFGPVGAVVGGLTGSRKSKERVVTEEETRSITLKIKVADRENPIYFVEFASAGEAAAETFYSHILNILREQQNDERRDDAPVKSVADELERLWKLKEAGALTAEEYENEKSLIRNHHSRSFLRSADAPDSKPLDKTELGETQ